MTKSAAGSRPRKPGREHALTTTSSFPITNPRRLLKSLLIQGLATAQGSIALPVRLSELFGQDGAAWYFQQDSFNACTIDKSLAVLTISRTVSYATPGL